jgi:hypothetical protein
MSAPGRNDVNIVQNGSGTAYMWGGWDETGFHYVMWEVDLVTGAKRVIDLSKTRYLSQGFVSNPAWNWIPGKLLYLTNDGTMSQDRPTEGTTAILGIAYSATVICFSPQPAFSVS